jgi:hypothetical protein
LALNQSVGVGMKYKGLVWVSCLATVFLFLPSLAMILWRYFIDAPWSQKSWAFYLLLGYIIIQGVRARRRFHKKAVDLNSPEALIFLAKQRLVKGELSIEEFRQIREEIK